MKLKLFFPVLMLLITGCSKKSSNSNPPADDPDFIGLSTGVKTNILMIRTSPTTYQYLYDDGSNYIYRGNTDPAASLTDLAAYRNCVMKIQLSDPTVAVGGSSTGGSGTADKQKVIFRVSKNDSRYFGISKGGTVSGQPEVRLSAFYFSTRPNPAPNYIQFILHKMSPTNGNSVYTLESVEMPGYYLDNTGHAIVTNGVRLVQHTNPAEATHFEFR